MRVGWDRALILTFLGNIRGAGFQLTKAMGEVDTTHATLSISQLCASARVFPIPIFWPNLLAQWGFRTGCGYLRLLRIRSMQIGLDFPEIGVEGDRHRAERVRT